MSWERGAGFRVCGAVVRAPFISSSGKFGKLTLGVPGGRGETKVDVRAFDLLVIEEMRALGAGQTVQITGAIDMEPVKDKKGEKVIIDGYAQWVPALTAKAIKVEGSSVAAAPAATGAAPVDKGW